MHPRVSLIAGLARRPRSVHPGLFLSADRCPANGVPLRPRPSSCRASTGCARRSRGSGLEVIESLGRIRRDACRGSRRRRPPAARSGTCARRGRSRARPASSCSSCARASAWTLLPPQDPTVEHAELTGRPERLRSPSAITSPAPPRSASRRTSMNTSCCRVSPRRGSQCSARRKASIASSSSPSRS